MLNQRLQASNTDNMVMLAGLTRARGFRLDDYGVVFDVEFPSMRRSMVWSMQELEKRQRRRAGPCARPTTPAGGPAARDLSDRNHQRAGQRHPRLHGVASASAPTSGSPSRRAKASSIGAFVPADPNDTAITIILRIKGSDLQALRERHAHARGRAEARRREALLITAECLIGLTA